MRKLMAAGLACSLLLGACGGGGGAIPIDQLGDRLETIACAQAVQCGSYPDMAACTGSINLDLGQLEAGVKSGRIHYDGVAAAACLDAFGARGCTRSGQTTDAPEACDRTFQGTLPDGANCFVNEECASLNCANQICDPVTMCCPGTCAAAIATIPQGGDCSMGGRCAEGTSCGVGAGGTLTCQPRLAAGQPCNATDICALGLTCRREAGAASGVCGSYPKRGEPCANILQCDDSRDTCDATTGTCVARGAPGAACASPTSCVTYANCDAATMKCVAKQTAGGACTQRADCLSSLDCTNGVCAAPPPDPICS